MRISASGSDLRGPARRRELTVLARLFELHGDELVHGLIAAGYQDASDAVQEAFVQAVAHWQRVTGYDDSLVSIRRVAINNARNRARSRRRLVALINRVGQRTRRAVGVFEPPDDNVIAAAAALPTQQRLAVTLFYYADLPVVDVAKAMGISEGTVKSHLQAACAAVARCAVTSSRSVAPTRRPDSSVH